MKFSGDFRGFGGVEGGGGGLRRFRVPFFGFRV